MAEANRATFPLEPELFLLDAAGLSALLASSCFTGVIQTK